ncbi:hypothetical protein [Hydrotalea sandarakina]|jgi:hypothetical protein|uniref:Uncharacterized protein n=1 Tax=Hydrotalea sandarakina TaxID=1004304 RepID=A0A2W7RGJ0_9BACT|nr:hypothetical protein [Hydrotalea sandarakina]PZX60053.1 hypothetical protein LX80_02620 [Hydrotalea sandarakina]
MSLKTYSEFVNLLEKFSKGDDTVLNQLMESDFKIDKGSAYRYCLKVESAYKERKLSWLDKFHRSFQVQTYKSINEFEITLHNAFQNFIPLAKFIALKDLPKEVSEALKKDLESFIEEIKKTLRKNISPYSNKSDHMLMLINAFTLSNILENFTAVNTGNKKEKSNSNDKQPPLGRQIIF